jgi:hypothetical protein
VHRVRSGSQSLAFLGIETSLPRPAQAPRAPLGRPSASLLESEAYEFATAQSIRLAPGEGVSIEYRPDARPVVRVLVCLAGPPLREVEIQSGLLLPERIDEREEHGQRLGGVAVLHPVTAPDVAGPCSLISNNSADEVMEGIVCDMF